MKKIKISDINIEKIKNNKLTKELPEVYQLKEVIENNDWHNQESVFDHTLVVLEKLKEIIRDSPPKIFSYLNQKIDNYSRKDLLFLSALFHDIGKKETLLKDNDITSCPNHEEHGSIKIKEILNRFDLSNKEKGVVIQIVKNHGLIHLVLDLKNDKLDQEYKKFKLSHSDIFLELILLATADTAGSYLQIVRPEEFKFRMNFYKKILNNYQKGSNVKN